MDVVFVVERTAAVGSSNWATVLQYMTNIVAFLTYGNSGARYGLVVYGNGPTNVFFLSNTATGRTNLANIILTTPYSADSGSDLYNALVTMRTEQFTQTNGDRANVPNVAILITASAPNDNLIIQEANNVKAAGIRLLTVGVGPGVNRYTLQQVSSWPQQVGVTVFLPASINDLSADSSTYVNVAFRATWLATGMSRDALLRYILVGQGHQIIRLGISVYVLTQFIF